MTLIKSTALISRWKMNEKTGTIINDSGRYKNNGTFGGGTGTNPTWSPDHGLTFDSLQKQIISVPNSSSLNITNNITIEGWVYMYSVPIGANYTILSKRQWYGELHGYGLGINADNKLNFTQGDGAVSNSVTRPIYRNILPQNKWFHLGLTYNGTMFVFYLNGVQLGTAIPSITSIAANNYPVSIGGTLGSNSNYHNGKISDLKIYNRAISANEISIIFNNTRTIYGV